MLLESLPRGTTQASRAERRPNGWTELADFFQGNLGVSRGPGVTKEKIKNFSASCTKQVKNIIKYQVCKCVDKKVDDLRHESCLTIFSYRRNEGGKCRSPQ